MLCSWDAEEYGLLGFFEYINGSYRGRHLLVNGVTQFPQFNNFLFFFSNIRSCLGQTP